IRTYLQHLGLFFKHLNGDGVIAIQEAINKANLHRVICQIPAEKASTRNNLLWSVKSFARFLGDLALLEEKIVEAMAPMKLKTKHKPDRPFLSKEEFDTVIQGLLTATQYDEMERLTNLSLFSTLGLTGLRSSELCSLGIPDIDFEKGIIHVIKGKGGKSRVVGMPTKLVPILRLYLTHRPGSASDRFFVGPKGTPLNRDLLGKRFARMSTITGIKASPHMLRRSFATDTAHKGVPLDKLQVILGHSEINTTRAYIQTINTDVAMEMRDW
ncbi:MAG TPA: site-specific integrase, partial [Chroococcales cyanobacterium]